MKVYKTSLDNFITFCLDTKSMMTLMLLFGIGRVKSVYKHLCCNSYGKKGRAPALAGSREGCQWQALPSPVQCEETATHCNSYGPLNKQMWKAKMPLKIKIFMWLTLQNSILN